MSLHHLHHIDIKMQVGSWPEDATISVFLLENQGGDQPFSHGYVKGHHGEFASHQNFTSETWIWWVVVWTRTSYVFCWDSIAACRIWDFAFVDIAINEYDLSNIVCHAGISVRLLRQMRSSLALVFVEVTAYQAVVENFTWGRGIFWLG